MSRSSRRHGRDRSRIATDPVLRDGSFDSFMRADRVLSSLPQFSTWWPSIPELLVEVEDRRRWTPDRYEPARTVLGAPARFQATPLPPAPRKSLSGAGRPFPGDVFSVSHRIGFRDARRVSVCVRRQARREVLHALGVAGRGAGSFKPRKRSEFSDVSCRR